MEKDLMYSSQLPGQTTKKERSAAPEEKTTSQGKQSEEKKEREFEIQVVPDLVKRLKNVTYNSTQNHPDTPATSSSSSIATPPPRVFSISINSTTISPQSRRHNNSSSAPITVWWVEEEEDPTESLVKLEPKADARGAAPISLQKPTCRFM